MLYIIFKLINIFYSDSNYNSNIKKRKYEEDVIFNDKNIEIEASRCFNKKFDESLTKFYLYDFEMNEKCLWSIANHYDNLNEWKKISIILGLEICDVQMIQAKYLISDGLKECFYQSLLKWRLKEPENCYLNYFLNKLYMNLNKTFDFINKLKDDITSKKTKNKTIFNMFQFYLTGLERKYEICLDKKKVSIKLNENQLWSASAFIFQEWKAISRTLNLNELDLISIETKYLQSDGIRECCYQSLLKWSQFYYEETSLENLCLSLIQMKFNLYAKQLLEEFCF